MSDCQKEVPKCGYREGFRIRKGPLRRRQRRRCGKVRVDSTRVINLEKFTDDVEVDPIYLDRPYYLAPDGPVNKEAFAVIREGA